MSARTIALATALTVGLGSAAMAQVLVIEPARPYYGPPVYETVPGMDYERGDRYDENFGARSYDDRIYDDNWSWRGKMRRDQYNNETGVNNN